MSATYSLRRRQWRLDTSMKESILDVLLYLFENYMIEDTEYQPDQEALARELAQAGFGDQNINLAFDWLENLSLGSQANDSELDSGTPTAIRHYDVDELARLDTTTRGLLLTLEHGGVLSPVERELVIDRLLALDADSLDADHVKWVVMMVLGNRSQNPADFEWLEDLMFDGIQPVFH